MRNDSSLKALVVKLRNEDKSFQEIRDILERDYGIVRSRQAICSIYNKIVEGMCKDAYESEMCISILMYKTLGYTAQEIVDILASSGYYCNKSRVYSVINNNDDVIAEFEKDNLNTVIEKISSTEYMSDSDIQELKDSMSYKYTEIKDDKFAQYVFTATRYKIEQYATEEIRKLYNILGDISYVNKLRNMQLNIPLKTIKEHNENL